VLSAAERLKKQFIAPQCISGIETGSVQPAG